MLTTEQLRAALIGVNLSALADRCGLNRKTLQRIRDGQNSPTLDNAEAIVTALAAIAHEQGRPDPLAPAKDAQQDSVGGPSDTGSKEGHSAACADRLAAAQGAAAVGA